MADSIVVLASGSPARCRILENAGIDAMVAPAPVDEDEIKRAMRAEGAQAIDVAVALAELKARRVAPGFPGALVIGADQVLEADGTWFDKPRDMEDARSHLVALRGRAHVLATAVCVVRGTERLWHHVETPKLTMRDFSDAFLESYLAAVGEAVLSSVGAYHIEGRGAQLFARVAGDFFTIQGLPLLPLLSFLREHRAVAA